MEEMGEEDVFSQGEEERVVLCENEEGVRGLYRSEGGVGFVTNLVFENQIISYF